MRVEAALITAGLMALASPARAQTSAFDGSWAVTVACPAVADSDGYTLRFPVRVAGGDLIGENGAPGMAGFLRLTGHIQPDGVTLLAAEGLVGSPRHAIGRIPSLTPYHYSAATRFTPSHGNGSRTSVRPCTLDFVRG